MPKQPPVVEFGIGSDSEDGERDNGYTAAASQKPVANRMPQRRQTTAMRKKKASPPSLAVHAPRSASNKPTVAGATNAKQIIKPCADSKGASDSSAQTRGVHKKKKRSNKKAGTKGEKLPGSDSLKKAAAAVARAIDKSWGIAPRAPMLRRPCIPDPSKTRRVLVIPRHAVCTMASGAANHATQTIGWECCALGLAAPLESSSQPWLPSFTSGALAQLDNFIVAYAQEALACAGIAREGCGRKLVSSELMQMGFDRADLSALAHAGLIGSSMCVGGPRSEAELSTARMAAKRALRAKIKASAAKNAPHPASPADDAALAAPIPQP